MANPFNGHLKIVNLGQIYPRRSVCMNHEQLMDMLLPGWTDHSLTFFYALLSQNHIVVASSTAWNRDSRHFLRPKDETPAAQFSESFWVEAFRSTWPQERTPRHNMRNCSSRASEKAVFQRAKQRRGETGSLGSVKLPSAAAVFFETALLIMRNYQQTGTIRYLVLKRNMSIQWHPIYNYDYNMTANNIKYTVMSMKHHNCWAHDFRFSSAVHCSPGQMRMSSKIPWKSGPTPSTSSVWAQRRHSELPLCNNSLQPKNLLDITSVSTSSSMCWKSRISVCGFGIPKTIWFFSELTHHMSTSWKPPATIWWGLRMSASLGSLAKSLLRPPCKCCRCLLDFAVK